MLRPRHSFILSFFHVRSHPNEGIFRSFPGRSNFHSMRHRLLTLGSRGEILDEAERRGWDPTRPYVDTSAEGKLCRGRHRHCFLPAALASRSITRYSSSPLPQSSKRAQKSNKTHKHTRLRLKGIKFQQNEINFILARQ